ncbi:hypothetical protein PPL_06041 [Heterostelium album PN500]|uniref:Uncharacterized protein n=1 Tax=Heterostelium pallidum (strain ATCC 26659 / Pp 5 / PN500) TaxID=670386 RepID=D3BC20_HETP5|nr:hypothetical protein PPL_06041 [Heterostelium album PN500]EFA81203.1 hypothetical protein PPL_06041 [Heterostelium album PN500]|eukprot:XP_020433321.1 hypothetical protein PPL_06041 [Heterostelium album PN500]
MKDEYMLRRNVNILTVLNTDIVAVAVGGSILLCSQGNKVKALHMLQEI